MARRSQCSSAGDNPLDPNYLPPHYREEYRLAIDALVEEDLEGYYQFLKKADVVDFLSSPEIQYIQESVQLPQQSNTEQRSIETGIGDGSSDTYWPVHSDLDAPGLDLGWPQIHHFIGPTEVTTLVNPPEPDMPSIKEQARRLIKNAQQVIAIVMDMFTDVDILHDILNAAMRNVAVYILLDEQNTHHFINMVANCRVNLQSIQFLRVRTVSGITYHCRSGKSFKGQMMDRFLLTDCRAVLSGNYSFMWSFEKIHRCMAHLFLGQLVSTFDEEFRILFAQSQPLVIEQMFDPVEDFSLIQKRQYPSNRPLLYREPRKFMSPQPEEWARHPYEEHMDVDWRMRPLKRRETFHGPADGYNRFPSQQAHVDPPLEQGPYRTAIMDNPAFKRHSYAEGITGRYQFLQQQGVPEPDDHARQLHRQQPPYMGQGKETDYNATYNKFWNQDYLADPYSEPPEMEPDSFDPVLNYLSSTRNVDFDQGSDKLPPAAELPYSSPYPRRLCTGQTYACQTSPTPSNPTEQKFFLEPNLSRKDPMVKRGLRDWRISSYLSTYDSKGDEGLPLAPPDATDPFEEPSNLMQQTAPVADLPMSKIPNVREFKVPAVPRASQIPSYAKNMAHEQTKKLPDEPSSVLTEAKRTPTPTPSESSSTTEGEKAEEAEQKEPKMSLLHREDSFRRKYNAAIPRSSRLRSSLIFSSLDQQHSSQDNKTAPGQQDEEGDKSEAEPTKKTFVSQVLGQRKPAREPIEWSRFIKTATTDNSATDSSTPEEKKSKAEDKDSPKDENSKDLSEKQEVQESLKLPNVEETKPFGPPTSLFQSSAGLDMSDPDMRLKFFKELAAKRRAEKASEAQKEKAQTKAPVQLKKQTAGDKEKPDAKEATEKMAATEMSTDLSEKHGTAEDMGQKVSAAACDSGEQTAVNSSGTKMDNSQVKNDPNPAPVFKESQTEVTTDSETAGPKSSQPVASPPVSAEPKLHQSKPAEKLKPLNPAEEKSSTSFPPTNNSAPTSDVSPKEDTVESKTSSPDSTSAETTLVASSPVDSSPSTASASVDSKIINAESVPVVTTSHSPPQQPQQQTGLESCSSDPSSSDQTLMDSGLKIIPGQSPSSSSPLQTPAGTISSSVNPEESALTSSTLSATTSPLAPSLESTQSHPDSIFQLTSSETPSAADSAHLKSDLDSCGADSEPKTSSSQPEKEVPKSEDRSVPCVVEKESEDVKTQSTPPTLDPVSPESSLTKSKPDQNGITAQSPSPAPPLSERAETDLTKICQDPPTQASQSEPNLTGLVSTPSADKASCCPPTESAEPVLSPEAEKTLLHSPPHSTSLPEQVSADSNVTPVPPSKDTCSPAEFTSNVPAETDQPCKTPESVISETHPTEQPENTKDSQNEASQESVIPNTDEEKTDRTDAINEVNKATTQEAAHCEKTEDQVKENNCSDQPETASGEVPLSPQTKQAKTSQSRYQSSTANVLSSSNLRDDTKLLLEQISANSQSRNEASKEAPVTDDEKEDEADKKAKKGKERGAKLLNKGQSKSTQERDKLLEKIQSMRKERKVYSRFEMAP